MYTHLRPSEHDWTSDIQTILQMRARYRGEPLRKDKWFKGSAIREINLHSRPLAMNKKAQDRTHQNDREKSAIGSD